MHTSAPSRCVALVSSRSRSLSHHYSPGSRGVESENNPNGGAARTPSRWQSANVIAILIFIAVSWLAASQGASAQGLILTSTPSGITETGQNYRQVNLASGDGPAYLYSLAGGAVPAGTSLDDAGIVRAL